MRAGDGSKGDLHPRNPHAGRYDFTALCDAVGDLSPHLRPNPKGDRTIDFADPEAVLCLNRALLAHHYDIENWRVPPGYLCPPIPGRADYIHYLADLLETERSGSEVRVLDVGTGASCIYPIIGHRSYGWRFVGSDIDETAVRCAREIVRENPTLAGAVDIVLQERPSQIFAGVVREADRFDLTLCNPPFFASAKDAERSHQRKVRNLSKGTARSDSAGRNFGGQSHELWCSGGELRFLSRMIRESADFSEQVSWFTSLVSKREHLSPLKRRLAKVGASRIEVVEMAQGNKRSRFLAWNFR